MQCIESKQEEKLSPDVEEGEDSLGKKFNRNGGETEEEAECVGLFCEQKKQI